MRIRHFLMASSSQPPGGDPSGESEPGFRLCPRLRLKDRHIDRCHGRRTRPGDADTLLSTAFSMHANPGAYALLIGAGVSYPSGIPTAWGVLTDLCTRMAAVEGQDLAGKNPAEWYTRTHGAE